MLQQSGEYAGTSAAAGGFDRADAHITRTALKLDERGWSQPAAAKKWLGEVQRLEEAAHNCLQSDTAHHQALDVGLVLMLFEALPFSAASAPARADAGKAVGHRRRRTRARPTPAR